MVIPGALSIPAEFISALPRRQVKYSSEIKNPALFRQGLHSLGTAGDYSMILT